jgi:hypothetical protein
MIKRNELLGSITQFIIALHDENFLTDNILDLILTEHGVTFTALQENRSFVEGVWSGFTWPGGVEGHFWRKLITYKNIEVVSVEEVSPIPCENKESILTEEQEKPVDEEVAVVVMGQDTNEVVQP